MIADGYPNKLQTQLYVRAPCRQGVSRGKSSMEQTNYELLIVASIN